MSARARDAFGGFKDRKIRPATGRSRQGVGLHIDVIKFFDSVNQAALREHLRSDINCRRTLNLLDDIIGSYHSARPSDAVSTGEFN